MQKMLDKQDVNHLKKLLIAGAFLLIVSSIWAKSPVWSQRNDSIPPPRIIRTCCSFGVDLSLARIPFTHQTDITCVEDLGNHHYLGGPEEGNGNIYTYTGGFIDIGHLRDCADWTAYLHHAILKAKEDKQHAGINLGIEGGAKTLTLTLPEDMDMLETYQLAGKIAYDLALWHEISTWFGASYLPLIPERYSSFSPEDLYSNLLGAQLGIRALKSELEYDEAMTQLIVETLDSLEAVSTLAETYDAMEQVESVWWTNRKPLPSKKILLMRYLDSDTTTNLLPWLIPGDARIPYKVNKPAPYLSNFYELKIKLNYKFPVKLMFPARKNREITQQDFKVIMGFVVKEVEGLKL